MNTRSQVDSLNNQSSPVYTTHHVRVVFVAMLDMTDIQRRTSKSKRNGVFKVDFARFRNDSTHFLFFTTHSNVSYHDGKPEPRG